MVKWEDEFKHYSITCRNELRKVMRHPDPGSKWRPFVDKTELGSHWVWAAGVQAPLSKMKFLLTERTRTAWIELHMEVVCFPASLFQACYCRTCQLWRLYSIGEVSSIYYWRCIGCGGGFCLCSKRQGAAAFLNSSKCCHTASTPLLKQDAIIGLSHHLLTLCHYELHTWNK
jgi:hypothetical protein